METEIDPVVREFLEAIRFRVVDLENELIFQRNHNPHRIDFINAISERLEENKTLLLLLDNGKSEIYQ